MAAKTPGKLFGIGDVLIGYLDYTNNKPMMSKAKAYENMLQAMSFGIYRGGDKQNLEEIKTKFIENGGDGKIFDQVVDLNKSNFKMKGYIENIKKSYKDLSSAGYEDMAKKQMKSALNNVKTMGEKNLDKFAQYKTDLADPTITSKDAMSTYKQSVKDAIRKYVEQYKKEPLAPEGTSPEYGGLMEQPMIFETMIGKWEEACKAANCNYLSVEYPEFTINWPKFYQSAINAKPMFIKKALESCGGRGILYVDGDMLVHKYPKIFDLQNVDIMAHGWGSDPRTNIRFKTWQCYDPYIFETSGGTMFYANTPANTSAFAHSKSFLSNRFLFLQSPADHPSRPSF